MVRVIDPTQAEESDCSCYKINPGEGVRPSNLMCHVDGVAGFLNDEKEKEFCFEGKWEEFEEKIDGMSESEVNDMLIETDYVDMKSKNGVAIAKTPERYKEHLNRLKNDVGQIWEECLDEEKGKKFWGCVESVSDKAKGLYGQNTDELRSDIKDRGISPIPKRKAGMVRAILKDELEK